MFKQYSYRYNNRVVNVKYEKRDRPVGRPSDSDEVKALKKSIRSNISGLSRKQLKRLDDEIQLIRLMKK